MMASLINYTIVKVFSIKLTHGLYVMGCMLLGLAAHLHVR